MLKDALHDKLKRSQVAQDISWSKHKKLQEASQIPLKLHFIYCRSPVENYSI